MLRPEEHHELAPCPLIEHKLSANLQHTKDAGSQSGGGEIDFAIIYPLQ
jgi:hypothetical protein